jgi:hypothetical protein
MMSCRTAKPYARNMMFQFSIAISIRKPTLKRLVTPSM